MPRFRYRALDPSGATVAGEAEGVDVGAVVEALRAQGRLPVAVRPAAGFDLRALLATEITPSRALSPGDRIAFTRSLATLTGAGLPLDRALEIAGSLGDRRAGRAVADRLLAAVRGGAALSAAMAQEGSAFPPLYLGVIRAGEAGAALPAALARLADAEETAARRAAKLRGALIYPAFLVAAAAGSIAVLLLFVVPTFEPLLADAGAEPPAATRIVLGAGRLLAEGWPWLIALVAALWLGARLALRREATRLAVARARLRLPVVGPLVAKLESARLARLLGEATTGGVALPAALRLAAGAAGDAAFRAELHRVAPEVDAGRGLARPLAEGRVAAPLALQLIRVGEESGRLAPMLLKAADILDAEAQAALDRALALLSPALTLAMGGVIALIVSSILFALLQINELAL